MKKGIKFFWGIIYIHYTQVQVYIIWYTIMHENFVIDNLNNTVMPKYNGQTKNLFSLDVILIIFFLS